MTVVNFAITKPFEEKVREIIKTYGFQSKAEFFRFAAMNYIIDLEKNISDEEELEILSSELKKTLKKRFSNSKLPSVEQQLEDL